MAPRDFTIKNSDKSKKQKQRELKKLKPLSKNAMAKIRTQVNKTIKDTEMLLESLNHGVDGEPVDYEGGYAYIEENLREFSDALEKLEVHDEENCKIWGDLADKTLDTLDKAMKQYDSFVAQNKVDTSIGIGEYIAMQKDDIQKYSQKNKCTLRKR